MAKPQGTRPGASYQTVSCQRAGTFLGVVVTTARLIMFQK
jgi:hypothetical protein